MIKPQLNYSEKIKKIIAAEFNEGIKEVIKEIKYYLRTIKKTLNFK